MIAREIVYDVLAAAGICCLAYGASLFHPGAGWLMAGACLSAAGVGGATLVTRGRRETTEKR